MSACGHGAAVVAVAGDDVGHVVADHAAEPAALVALVGEVVADVGRGGDADRHGRRDRGPASAAASRTALMVHAAMSGSASCRMKPSPTSPVSASALGP